MLKHIFRYAIRTLHWSQHNDFSLLQAEEFVFAFGLPKEQFYIKKDWAKQGLRQKAGLF